MELREGRQRCQNETARFLRETIDLCRRLTDKPLLFRLDSRNYASENIDLFMEECRERGDVFFLIKRNLRYESKEGWLAHAEENHSSASSPREGKSVYIGITFRDVTYQARGGERTDGIRVVYEVTERTIDKHGQYLLPHDVEADTYWTSLPLPNLDVIALYHAHGECEQFHSEFKSDMGVERLPSRKFETNSLVLDLAMVAYNVLRRIGQESLRKPYGPMRRQPRRRRIQTVIGNLILFAEHLTAQATGYRG